MSKQLFEMVPQVLRVDTVGIVPAAADLSESGDDQHNANGYFDNICDNKIFLRNEATAEPNDLGGCGRLPQGDAPGAELAPPGARWTSQLDPSHPLSEASHCDGIARLPRNAPTAAPADPQKIAGTSKNR